MDVNGITNNTSLLLSAIANRRNTFLRPATAVANTTENTLVQAAQQTDDTLLNIASASQTTTDPLLFETAFPFLTVLQVNETLQDLKVESQTTTQSQTEQVTTEDQTETNAQTGTPATTTTTQQTEIATPEAIEPVVVVPVGTATAQATPAPRPTDTASPFLVVPQTTQQPAPVALNAPLVNEPLQGLNAVSAGTPNALPVNESPFAPTAAALTVELNLVEQTAAQVNEPLQPLAPEPQTTTPLQPQQAAAQIQTAEKVQTIPAAAATTLQPPDITILENAAPAVTADTDPTALVTIAATPAATAEVVDTTGNALLQAAQQTNETLLALASANQATTDALLTGTAFPSLTVLQATQDLTPLQQNALLINETLQGLNTVTRETTNALLIDEIPPALEAAGITEELDLVLQSALEVNETLQNVEAEPQTTTLQQTGQTIAQNLTVAEEETGAAVTTTTQQAAATTLLEETEPAASTGAATAAVTTTAAATPAATTTAAAEEIIPLPTQGLTPATLPLTLFPDRTPYVLAVYQTPDSSPLPGSPVPISREVAPAPPIARIRAVSEARLRQALQRRREGGETRIFGENTAPPPLAQAEKSIRHTISETNAVMATQGLPLHLVLARHEEGWAIDIYDCSFPEACRMSYDVPFQLDNLTGVLGNIEQEKGIIVDKAS